MHSCYKAYGILNEVYLWTRNPSGQANKRQHRVQTHDVSVIFSITDRFARPAAWLTSYTFYKHEILPATVHMRTYEYATFVIYAPRTLHDPSKHSSFISLGGSRNVSDRSGEAMVLVAEDLILPSGRHKSFFTFAKLFVQSTA